MEFHFHSFRTRCDECITMQLHDAGWLVQFGVYGAITEPNGYFLGWVLRRHGVNVPAALNDALEELWNAAQQGALKPDEVQERLNGFSEWLAGFNPLTEPAMVLPLRFGT